MKPIQNLNGYEKPWVGGAGKNKLDQNDLSVGYYKDTDFSVVGNDVYASYKVYLDAGTYTVSFGVEINMIRKIADGIMQYDTASNITEYTFTTTTDGYAGLSWRRSDNTSWDSSTNVQLESGSMATAWSPYENICPISGSTGATIYQTGKNLYPTVRTRTNNGITFAGENGTYHVSGTATAAATNDVVANYANYPKFPAGTYVIGTSGANCRVTIRQFNDDGTAYAPLIFVPYSSEYTLTLEKDLIVMLGLYVASGTTLDEDIYLMMQRSESGNLVASTPDAADSPIGYDTWYFPSGTYEYSFDTIGGISTYIKGQLIDPNDPDKFVGSINVVSGMIPTTLTGTINVPFPNSARLSFSHRADNLVFKRVYSTDSVFEEYIGTTYAVAWQSDAGTVYGGTYDFVSGVLTVTMVMHSFDGTETITEAGSRYFRYSISSNPADDAGKAVSSHFEYINSFASKPFGTFTMTSGNIVFNDADSVFADATAFQAFLAAQSAAGTPVQVCYTLATPTTYQITPEQIKSFNGKNNIWAMLTQGA